MHLLTVGLIDYPYHQHSELFEHQERAPEVGEDRFVWLNLMVGIREVFKFREENLLPHGVVGTSKHNVFIELTTHRSQSDDSFQGEEGDEDFHQV